MASSNVTMVVSSSGRVLKSVVRTSLSHENHLTSVAEGEAGCTFITPPESISAVIASLINLSFLPCRIRKFLSPGLQMKRGTCQPCAGYSVMGAEPRTEAVVDGRTKVELG